MVDMVEKGTPSFVLTSDGVLKEWETRRKLFFYPKERYRNTDSFWIGNVLFDNHEIYTPQRHLSKGWRSGVPEYLLIVRKDRVQYKR